MKITLKKLIAAAPALQNLGTKDIPLKTAYRLQQMRELLNKELVFYVEREKSVLEKYGTPGDSPGAYTFDTLDLQRKAQSELEELLNFEAEPAIVPLEISTACEITLSADYIAALEPLVIFSD
jgi:hypothetical protein